jgi:hypothetical protein
MLQGRDSKIKVVNKTIYRKKHVKLILNHQEVVPVKNYNIAVRKMSRSKQLYLFNQVYPDIPVHVE